MALFNECPFCGGTHDLRFYVSDNDGWHKEAHITCDECNVEMTEWVDWEKYYDSSLPDNGSANFNAACVSILSRKWNTRITIKTIL